MASTSAAAAFYAEFGRMKADVIAALDGASTPSPSSEGAISSASAASRLTELRTALATVRASLPPYDQRSYDLQIKELEGRLATKRVDRKPKFAFKRAVGCGSEESSAGASPHTGNPSGRTSVNATPPPNTTTPSPGPLSAPTASQPVSAPIPPLPPTYTLSRHNGMTLTEADLPSAQGNYTLTLSKLSRCVVDLRPLGSARLTSLHAADLTDTVVIAPPPPPGATGSALLTRLTGCTVVLSTQQFRLHEATDTLVALHVPSLPVIEGCARVVFAPYPQQLGGDGSSSSKYDQVQDFDWVRGGASPHWRTATAEERKCVDALIARLLAGEAITADEAIQSIPCIQRNTN